MLNVYHYTDLYNNIEQLAQCMHTTTLHLLHLSNFWCCAMVVMLSTTMNTIICSLGLLVVFFCQVITGLSRHMGLKHMESVELATTVDRKVSQIHTSLSIHYSIFMCFIVTMCVCGCVCVCMHSPPQLLQLFSCGVGTSCSG